MKKKILITGAGGYIGSIATFQFLQKGYEVVGIDNFSTGYKRPLQLLQEKFGKEKLRFYHADLTNNLHAIFDKEPDIDAVIHYAANCSVDESINNPRKYFVNNTLASQNLLSTMMDYHITNIIFSSTCAVYGEAKYLPIDENHQTVPTSPYGESKLMTEKIIKRYGNAGKMRYVILRYFNVCGATEDGSFGDSKSPSIHLVQNALRGALDIEPFYLTFPAADTSDQTPIRDYVNVLDLNEAHIRAVTYLLRDGKSEVINLGTGQGNSVLDIIKEVERLTGAKLPFKKSRSRQGEYAKMVASISKAHAILGWKPKHTLTQSIQSLISWYQKNPYGWLEYTSTQTFLPTFIEQSTQSLYQMLSKLKKFSAGFNRNVLFHS